MASNNSPLTEIEKTQLRSQPNVHMIVEWARNVGISNHPEVLKEIEERNREVRKNICILNTLKNHIIIIIIVIIIMIIITIIIIISHNHF